jgi:hypothetical protein
MTRFLICRACGTGWWARKIMRSALNVGTWQPDFCPSCERDDFDVEGDE